MGLTKSSVSTGALDRGLNIEKRKDTDKVIAIAGNPNVGKSTVFNALTGLKQHTGNWSGKTVSNAQGRFSTKKRDYVLVDIPGTYSLLAHSKEEEVARNFLCFGECDATVVVCDATCIERNLNLVLQCMEVSERVLVCVNLIDEAKKKHIKVNTKKLSQMLCVDVIEICARDGNCKKIIGDALDALLSKQKRDINTPVIYEEVIEMATSELEGATLTIDTKALNTRWLCRSLLSTDTALTDEIYKYLNLSDVTIEKMGKKAEEIRSKYSIGYDGFEDSIVSAIIKKAESIACTCVCKADGYNSRDMKIDKVLTGKKFGYLLMLALLLVIFWITIAGANYPSELLSWMFGKLGEWIKAFFIYIELPSFITRLLADGVYRVLSWVVAVMLPPMAIFFPLFTILEDFGYLPRVAYNLDRPFCRCNACGKQALTMCMGFGCNAAAVTGARIIDSKRERMLAILTNTFVPCNGRFPALVSIIGMFFLSGSIGIFSSVLSTLILAIVILSGIFMSFAITKLLSLTLLRGMSSSYTLELPPFRRPQFSKVIVRSAFDRTLFVLGRAVAVAAPAGAVIYILANTYIGDASVISHCARILEPLGSLMGLDGVILLSFLLGFPANEIVLPLVLMTYLSSGNLAEINDMSYIKEILLQNGWSALTAVNFIIFSLFHFPCSTTLLTVKKETGSIKWTVAAALIPTLVGIVCCIAVTSFSKLCMFFA